MTFNCLSSVRFTEFGKCEKEWTYVYINLRERYKAFVHLWNAIYSINCLNIQTNKKHCRLSGLHLPLRKNVLLNDGCLHIQYTVSLNQTSNTLKRKHWLSVHQNSVFMSAFFKHRRILYGLADNSFKSCQNLLEDLLRHLKHEVLRLLTSKIYIHAFCGPEKWLCRHAAKQISILSIILLSVFLKYKQNGTFGSFQVEVNDAVWLILLRHCRISEI